jgi:hypothetical protein
MTCPGSSGRPCSRRSGPLPSRTCQGEQLSIAQPGVARRTR